jgi:uncharacterized phage protein (TIGR01671 family)
MEGSGERRRGMMSRPIKFRAWVRELKRMGEVLALDFDHKMVRVRLDNVTVQRFELMPDVEVMQFTGLLDRYGKEIYEGDILATSNDGADGADEWDQEVMPSVSWHAGHACYEGLPDCEDDDSIYATRYVEVIGNVYENPELSKQA